MRAVQGLTALVLAGFVAYIAAWYFGAVEGNFALLLFLATLAVFYHLCNGIRHLIWDSVRAFELRSIYAGGWAVVAASLILTSALWLWVLT